MVTKIHLNMWFQELRLSHTSEIAALPSEIWNIWTEYQQLSNYWDGLGQKYHWLESDTHSSSNWTLSSSSKALASSLPSPKTFSSSFTNLFFHSSASFICSLGRSPSTLTAVSSSSSSPAHPHRSLQFVQHQHLWHRSSSAMSSYVTAENDLNIFSIVLGLNSATHLSASQSWTGWRQTPWCTQ